ncbi:hypothetical protein JCM11491_005281 [Sporobolomyces phaffii]
MSSVPSQMIEFGKLVQASLRAQVEQQHVLDKEGQPLQKDREGKAAQQGREETVSTRIESVSANGVGGDLGPEREECLENKGAVVSVDGLASNGGAAALEGGKGEK